MADEKHSNDPFSHVVDSDHFSIFETIGWEIKLPAWLTKFMVLEAVAAIIIIAALLWLAKKVKTGELPRGKLWNFLEAMFIFVRDKIARPSIGHGADAYVPLLMTFFFFILICNLLGMLPFLGSPTASLSVTGVLAVIAFFVIHISGLAQHGLLGYMRTFVPHIELDSPILKIMGPFLLVGLTFVEVLTAFIRAIVLAVRLFANMLAGHVALYVMLSFIKMAADASLALFLPVTVLSVGMVTALSLLEVFVAGLQAFIFTLLTAVFIGLAKHPPH
jgi:F-type H+-transporting ATPase subunit a